LNAAYLKSTLTSGSTTEKLNALEYLKDQFDSFDKNIESFELLIDVLLNAALTESDMAVKIEIFESLAKAAVFQDITAIDFTRLSQNIDRIPEECLGRTIDILSFTYEINYLPIIKRYLNHPDLYIRESAEYGVKEILGV